MERFFQCEKFLVLLTNVDVKRRRAVYRGENTLMWIKHLLARLILKPAPSENFYHTENVDDLLFLGDYEELWSVEVDDDTLQDLFSQERMLASWLRGGITAA